jgi:hypothetical protein
MKKQLLLLSLGLLSFSSLKAQVCGGNDTLFSTPVTLASTPAFITDDADFVAFNPNNANEAWASGKAGMLVKMTRTNQTWTATQQDITFSGLSTRRFRYIQFLSNSDWRLIGDGANSSDSATVFRSTNQGSSWSIFSKIPTQEVYFAYTHPTSSNWMIAGTRAGIWVSKNNGANWVQQSVVPGQRYYGVDLNTSTGRVTIARRAGVILSTVVSDFSVNGSDSLAWTNEVTDQSTFSVGGTTVTFGTSKVNLVISTNNGATRWAIADNPNGAVMLRSSATGTWEAITIDGYDYVNNGELRWIAAWSNDVLFAVDNAGGMFYTTNASAAQPTWSFMQANAPSSLSSDYTLNVVAVVPASNPPAIMVVGSKAEPTINLFPIMNFITCTNLTANVRDFEKQSLRVYPNPVENQLTIEQEAAGVIEIRNLPGALVMQLPKAMGAQQIDLIGLKPGVYLVSLQTKQGIFHSRIIKK